MYTFENKIVLLIVYITGTKTKTCHNLKSLDFIKKHFLSCELQ